MQRLGLHRSRLQISQASAQSIEIVGRRMMFFAVHLQLQPTLFGSADGYLVDHFLASSTFPLRTLNPLKSWFRPSRRNPFSNSFRIRFLRISTTPVYLCLYSYLLQKQMEAPFCCVMETTTLARKSATALYNCFDRCAATTKRPTSQSPFDRKLTWLRAGRRQSERDEFLTELTHRLDECLEQAPW
jgi:hypothetical protein